MLFRLLGAWIWRRPGRFILAILAVAVGAALAGALLGVALDIQERMAEETRAYGANIMVVPKAEPLTVDVMGLSYRPPEEGPYLNEEDIPKLKTIFWRHNIVAFAPFLSGSVEVNGVQASLVGTWFEQPVAVEAVPTNVTVAGRTVAVPEGDVSGFRTGIRALDPWWQVEGAWGEDASAAMIGRSLAQQLGLSAQDRVRVTYEGRTREFVVAGVVTTGGVEDSQIIVDLDAAQDLLGLPGKVERVQVSALVKPDDALAQRAKRDPTALPEEEFVKWYCSPYIDAVAFQIEEVVGNSKAKVIRRVAEAEGAFLGDMGLTMLLVAAVALTTSGVGVMAAMTGRVYERTREIGLMRGLGADDGQIALLFGVEATLIGLSGGLVGYGGGSLLSRLIGQTVFETQVGTQPVLLPVVLIVAVALSLAGSAPPVRHAILAQPADSMREHL